MDCEFKSNSKSLERAAKKMKEKRDRLVQSHSQRQSIKEVITTGKNETNRDKKRQRLNYLEKDRL